MAATREQKRRQQAALRRAIQIIRAEHPDLWADAYRRARALVELAAAGVIPGENGAPALPTIGDNALATGFLREVPW